MTAGRAWTITLAGVVGVIVGIVVTLVSQGREPTSQLGSGRRVIRAGPNIGLRKL
ncbi:MAG TPA: hypothetical protein VJB15_11580 [Rhodothermia bacterium]|nr:hypothetical protein [Rhodothermia bacterium]